MGRKGDAYLGGHSVIYGPVAYVPERPNLDRPAKKEKIKPEIQIIKTALDRKAEAFLRELKKKQRKLERAGKFTGRIIPTLNKPTVEAPVSPAAKAAESLKLLPKYGRKAFAILTRWDPSKKSYKDKLNGLIRECVAHLKQHGDGTALAQIIMAIPSIHRRNIACSLLKKQANLVLSPKGTFRVSRFCTPKEIDPAKIDIFVSV
jgi:hypothetical protein